MFKKRYFSPGENFRTGIFCRLTFYLGIILLIISIIFRIISMIGQEGEGFIGDVYSFSQTTIPGSIFAFSIIFLAVSVIFYFFNCQFAKLAKIAEEIENSEEHLEEAE